MLLIVGGDVVASHLPAAGSAGALLAAIEPWLEQAQRTRQALLRHGPADVEPRYQRSCFVAPLLAGRERVGCL